jgi:hypothetical protein
MYDLPIMCTQKACESYQSHMIMCDGVLKATHITNEYSYMWSAWLINWEKVPENF